MTMSQTLNRRYRRSLIALAISGLTVSGAASAQNTLLEEVIVTAQKREESTQNIPLTISALSADMLAKRSIRNTQDLLLQTPGVMGFESPGSKGTTTITIRGIGAGQPANLSVDPAVGVYMDGVFIGKQLASALDVAEVDRVEVLRGPQGTLYGRNSVGGAINFISKKPTGEFGVKLQGGFGNYGSRNYKIVADLPAVGTVGEGLGRLSTNVIYQHRERDPFYDNKRAGEPGFNSLDRSAWRFAAKLDVTDNFTAEYIYDHSELDELNNLERLVGLNPLDLTGDITVLGTLQGLLMGAQYWSTQPGADSRIASRWIPSLQATIGAYSEALEYGEGRRGIGTADVTPTTDGESDGHVLTLTYAGDNFEIKSITALREIETYVGGDLEDIDSSLDANGVGAYGDLVHLTLGQIYGGTVAAVGVAYPSPFADAVWAGIDTLGANHSLQDTYSDYEQFSQELQMVGSSGRFDYAAGLYYFEDESDYARYAIFAAPLAGNGAQLYNLDTEAWAVYAQTTFQPSDDSPWHLTVGLRYTEEDKDVTWDYPAYYTPFGPAPGMYAEDDESYDDLSYNVALSYQPSDDLNLYGRYATGYRSGGFNGEMFGSDAFFEEKVKSWELGLKSRLFDGRLRANASVYGYVWEDIQTARIDTDGGSATSGLVNAGEAERWGAELELLGAVADNITLGLSYSHISGDFDEYPDLCGTSGVCLDGSRNARRANSPDNQVNVFADASLAQLPNGELTAFVSVSWQDEYPEIALWSNLVANNAYPRKNPHQMMDARTLVDAQLAWEGIQFGEGTLKVTLWGRNLLDDDYPMYAINFGALNIITENYGDPRTYGVNLTYEF